MNGTKWSSRLGFQAPCATLWRQRISSPSILTGSLCKIIWHFNIHLQKRRNWNRQFPAVLMKQYAIAWSVKKSIAFPEAMPLSLELMSEATPTSLVLDAQNLSLFIATGMDHLGHASFTKITKHRSYYCLTGTGRLIGHAPSLQLVARRPRPRYCL